jgi:hypothetical protein
MARSAFLDVWWLDDAPSQRWPRPRIGPNGDPAAALAQAARRP